VIAQGTPGQLESDLRSIMGPFLAGAPAVLRDRPARAGRGGQITIEIGDLYNQHDLTAAFPVHRLTALGERADGAPGLLPGRGGRMRGEGGEACVAGPVLDRGPVHAGRVNRQGQGRRRAPRPGLLRGIGPEIVAGASDNDPTNVGTAAVVGAQTGYRLSWVALLVAPLLFVVLAIAAQVGVVARGDLQSLARERYGRGVAAALLVSVVVVNVVTIAADLQAGAAGIGLLAGVSAHWLVLPLGLALAALLLIGKYGQVVVLLRCLLPGFLAFTAAAVLAHPDWPRLLEASLVPDLSLRRDELAGALALLGTTLTSYVYMWETVQRGVEEPGGHDQDGGRLARARAGAVASALFTAVILWSMLVASAATLGRYHHQAPASPQDAARALRPLAGPLAGGMFAAGLVVSAVVTLPVLIASTAYVTGAQFDWDRGLSQPIGRAPRFYAVLGASIGLAVAASLAGVPVLPMLVAASVIGGLGTPLGLVILVRLARDPQIMGDRPISRPLAAAGWTVAAVVAALGVLLILAAALGRL
jgi:Mn2+/Fe2+ NRAMP family transporter